MNRGNCLCESVSWEFSGTPDSAYHCHCSMCRKAHGAAFATYYYIPSGNFRWTGDTQAIVEYRSSPSLVRTFCGVCGSVVPGDDEEGQFVFTPAGCHDDGPAADCHIFTASKAPWFDITDDLPRYETGPDGDDFPVYESKAMAEVKPGIVRGSCLCGKVEFEVMEPFRVIYNCHCSRCRHARAAAHTTNGFTSNKGIRITLGEGHMKRYKLPTARFFTHVFCDVCGSGLPRIDHERQLAVVPLGALDDDPGMRPSDNIYVADKAGWYAITDNLPAHNEGP